MARDERREMVGVGKPSRKQDDNVAVEPIVALWRLAGCDALGEDCCEIALAVVIEVGGNQLSTWLVWREGGEREPG